MERTKRRGQAALEFLMTYSWAILVVIIVIGALAYFGVLDPTNLIPQTCQLETGFACADYRVAGEPAQIELLLRNGGGRPIRINNISYTNTAGNSCQTIALLMPATDFTIANGGTSGLIATSGAGCVVPNPGKKNKYVVQVSYRYTDVNSMINHTMIGELFARSQ